jgi:deoxyribodipyrimidine photo-lyase
MNNISIFLFRRSFRLYDNIGLINALKNSKKVLPIFIFTPEQIKNNKFKSNNAIQFMIESLIELNKELKKKKSKLYFFYGKQYKIISKINKEIEIDSVYLNKDYTPYAIKRDKKIKKICKKNNINYFEFEDILLRPVGSIKTNDNIYLKFTPYFRASSKIKINKPTKNIYSNYFKKKIKCEYKKDINNFYKFNEYILIKG